jgi:hypothetical protein
MAIGAGIEATEVVVTGIEVAAMATVDVVAINSNHY